MKKSRKFSNDINLRLYSTKLSCLLFFTWPQQMDEQVEVLRSKGPGWTQTWMLTGLRWFCHPLLPPMITVMTNQQFLSPSWKRRNGLPHPQRGMTGLDWLCVNPPTLINCVDGWGGINNFLCLLLYFRKTQITLACLRLFKQKFAMQLIFMWDLSFIILPRFSIWISPLHQKKKADSVIVDFFITGFFIPSTIC